MQPAKASETSNPSHRDLPGIVAGLYQVSKFFDSLWGGNLVRALTCITFEVRRGEVFGLLGPAGSGKSTAIKILAGKLRAMEGKVQVFGRSPRSGRIRARIGYLPERTRSAKTGSGSLRDSFDQWLGLGGHGTRTAGTGLMQALLNYPDLVLLDDPFDGLDERGVATMKQEIRALARKGKTVLLATRRLSEAYGVCDRVAVFRAGTLAAVGTFEELLTQTAALDFFAPVLSSTTCERVLAVIRDELERESAYSAISAPETSAAASPAAFPESVANEPHASRAVKSADPIDHGRLAELSRPASSSDASSPPDLKPGA